MLLEKILLATEWSISRGFQAFTLRKKSGQKCRRIYYVWLCILVYEKCASIIRDSYDNILENFRKINKRSQN